MKTESMEVVHNTLDDLIEDKDEIIQSQKTTIEGIQKDIETNIAAMRSNLEEAHNTAGYRDAEITKYKEEIAKLNGDTTTSSSEKGCMS